MDNYIKGVLWLFVGLLSCVFLQVIYTSVKYIFTRRVGVMTSSYLKIFYILMGILIALRVIQMAYLLKN